MQNWINYIFPNNQARIVARCNICWAMCMVNLESIMKMVKVQLSTTPQEVFTLFTCSPDLSLNRSSFLHPPHQYHAIQPLNSRQHYHWILSHNESQTHVKCTLPLKVINDCLSAVDQYFRLRRYIDSCVIKSLEVRNNEIHSDLSQHT